ncbi:MAG: zinc-dependent metalloprotease [Gemmatimonas sp.]|uniref:zinc-dependent metalloprotease n=1 Tax=Gemmatimonas sp. TaxID=1962908 RepID=UPI00391F0938
MHFRTLPLAVAGLALAACQPAKKPASAPTPANRPAPNATRPGGNAGAPGQPTPGQPTPGQPIPGQPLPGQPPAGGVPNLGALAGALGGAQADPNPRPYATVITPRAKSKKGVFDVHQVGSRLFFEIPASQIGKDFVITSVLAATPAGIGINGTLGTDRVIRFERRDNRVLVRDVNYRNVATDSTQQTARAMSLIEFFPIIAALNVEAYGKDSAAVIDVTRMFTGGVQEFTANGRRATVDASRSYIDKFSAFSRNVNVTAVQTFTPQGGAGGIPGLPIPIPGLGGTAQATTEAYTFSIVRLPDEPMMPRFLDARVGYFGETKQDFGSPEQRVLPRRYIARWRLECGDQKQGALCVPKKPITYYVDPATPKWLVPFVKAGIEEWQSAFEMAGFSKGIVAADAPNDPDFSGEDASVAMVRWLPSPVANAVGPSTTDPRTGEIIDADVQMYHNIMDLQRNWYFTQVGHLDTRAQRFPFPDTLMGRLVQFVVAHEVGHTLGFPHNFKGSSMYPVDSIRSKTWVAKMGHSPSIMDYARFNYIAQPEDGIAVGDLVPKVGPYDRFAVMWGYKPIPGVKRPEDEKSTLDQWARMQDSIPWYRFASDAGAGGADPGEQSEAIGDADAVRSTALGFKNIARVMKLMEPAATADNTADYSLLRVTYGAIVGQWGTEANHVTKIVGGSDKQEKAISQGGPVWMPVPRARQKAAMQFLNEQVFMTPKYLIDVPVLRKLESEGNINRITGAQARALSSLVNNTKLQRLVEIEATAPNKAAVYSLGEMLTDLRRGLWREIYAGEPIDAYRRRLQSTYLEAMASKIKPPPPNAQDAVLAQLLGGGVTSTRDFRPLLKDEMRVLDRELAAAIGRTGDRTSRAHLQDARDQIKAMLDTEK